MNTIFQQIKHFFAVCTVQIKGKSIDGKIIHIKFTTPCKSFLPMDHFALLRFYLKNKESGLEEAPQAMHILSKSTGNVTSLKLEIQGSSKLRCINVILQASPTDKKKTEKICEVPIPFATGYIIKNNQYDLFQQLP